MRILVLGAGGTGGYFGGRLAQGGVDVTFLVRPARARQLETDGLVIKSPLGDAQLPVRFLTADKLAGAVATAPFDLVLLSCKAYDLESAIEAIAPAMGEGTALLPILNGLRHYGVLDQRFGSARVMGGLSFISATKTPNGEVLHMRSPASITFGERDGDPRSGRCLALAAAMEDAGVGFTLSEQIHQDLWIKFTLFTALAAATCLLRADVGTIMATEGGREVIEETYAECLAVARAEGWPIGAEAQESARGILTQTGSRASASMFRDLEAGHRVEAEHIVGDMLHRAHRAGQEAPMLAAAWCHLQAYMARRGA
jgi:2-dehydropantoate 2-reductase